MGQHPAGAPDDVGVEPHLEQRRALVARRAATGRSCSRRPAPQPFGCDVEPVDDAAQLRAVRRARVRTSELALARLEAVGVLEREVRRRAAPRRWSATRRRSAGSANSSPTAGERSSERRPLRRASSAVRRRERALAGAAGRRGARAPRAPACRARRPSSAARAAGRSRGTGTAAGTAGSRWPATATGPGRDGGRSRDGVLDGDLDRRPPRRRRRVTPRSAGRRRASLVELLHRHASSVGAAAHTTGQRPHLLWRGERPATPGTTILRLGDRPRRRRPDRPGPELAHRRRRPDAASSPRPSAPAPGTSARSSTSSRSASSSCCSPPSWCTSSRTGSWRAPAGSSRASSCSPSGAGTPRSAARRRRPASSALVAVVGPLANLVLAGGVPGGRAGRGRAASSGLLRLVRLPRQRVRRRCSTWSPGCRSTAGACSRPPSGRVTGNRHTRHRRRRAGSGASSPSACSPGPSLLPLAQGRQPEIYDVVWAALIGAFLWSGRLGGGPGRAHAEGRRR